jgi:uncharacterized protein YecE (DUF72 family)
MQKAEVIAVLREMADLLEITEASPFEVMAYRNGAQSLEDWYGDLHDATATSTLTEIPAIGKGLSRVISDLVRSGSGSSAELDRVRSLVPPELPALLRVRGLGPKRVRALWRELGIESPEELRRAAADGRIEALRGFGAKMVQGILSGLDYLQKPRVRPTQPSPAPIKAQPDARKASGRIWAGTSGYSYPKWKGSFYPHDARPADFLRLYAQKLATVEINNTFYRFPSEKVIEEWKTQTPAHFRFALKAHRRFTHQQRLSPAAREEVLEFIERCWQLGDKLVCILFQLPPDFSRDDARLDSLLGLLPAGARFALEFRHESWFAEPVLARLREQNVACVSGDSADRPLRRLVTADFIYTRLRRSSYTDDELAEWEEWFREQTAAKRDVLAYLKHDESGDAPQLAVARWSAGKLSAARHALQKTLARPAKRSAKRGRKTG